MLFDAKEIQLKDGRIALFRPPEVSDAAIMLDYLKITAAETPFLLRTPEECTFTLEQEEKYLEMARTSENECTICCFVEGRFAGNCNLSRKGHRKSRHRGIIGIALMQEFWGLGIGSAMFRELLCLGRQWGLRQLELEVMEGNATAIGLYRKMGFEIIATHPDAFCLADGTYRDEYVMMRRLEE